ncbi:hypothetical protein B9G55_01885 [Saccharibacillus sp. O16]|nr:hypothetical protein B9G55_01885 [Saccharibacillus sp. O16]
MSNKYVKAMEEIEAGEDLKQAILRQARQGALETQAPTGTFRRKRGMVAAVSLVFVLLFLTLFNFRTPDPARPVSLWGGFTVTAYAANGAPVAVRPDVEFPLGKYSVFMSSVPGLPITLDAEGANRLEIRASQGQLLLWNPSDGQVKNQGNHTEIEAGGTLYWSPLSEEEGEKKQPAIIADPSTLNITAYQDGQKLGSASIEIKWEDGSEYTAKLRRDE